jgi:hypothetical protein
MVNFKRVLVMSLGLLAVGSIASATDVTQSLTFVGITPCRILDTRGLGFTLQAGPPSLVAGADRTFQITGTVPGVPAQCGIPTTAVAISVNFTVTGFAGQRDLRVFPAGSTLPLVSIINYQLENIANATTVPLGPSGGGQNGITVHCDAAGTDFLADVNGYYVPRPFTTLESGQTLVGNFVILQQTTAAGQGAQTSISFQVPLASAPAAPPANFIPAGGAPTSNCPGSPTNPTAAAGQLCLYERNMTNRIFAAIFSVANNAAGVSDTWGAGFAIASVAAGVTGSRGTWAVTAP